MSARTKRSSRSVSGGSSATDQASIETGQRILTKKREGVANSVGVQAGRALQYVRHLPEQLVGSRQCLRYRIWHGVRQRYTYRVHPAIVSCFAHQGVNRWGSRTLARHPGAGADDQA